MIKYKFINNCEGGKRYEERKCGRPCQVNPLDDNQSKSKTSFFALNSTFARYRAKFVGAKTFGDYLARKASIKLANKGKRGGRREAKKKFRKMK